MKNKFLVLISLLTLFNFYGCDKCELIEQTIESPDPTFSCPSLMANIGDACDDNNPDTIEDVINGNCECIGGGTVFDCPTLMLNIGDACTDNDETTINDMITDNCECVGESIFDCPDLSLNIGEACDDGNPDTENDTVDEMCICIGEPIMICQGTLYASRITVNSEGNGDGWFFDRAFISTGSPTVFSNLEEKMSVNLDPSSDFNSNFSAYDELNDRYTFFYQYGNGTPNPLYLAEPAGFSSVFIEAEAYYYAPVFLNGELYGINTFTNSITGITQYTIVSVDETTGITTDLFTDNNIVTNSPMINNAISSTRDDAGNIYFMSSTNLIVYNPAGNFSTYVDIDNTYNSDGNEIFYYGLEYKPDTDEVLAIKGIINSQDKVAELVSISTDGNYFVNTIFDIKNNLGSENDEEISIQFYSTTFSSCDNTYYISELVALESDPIESFLIEINLNENTLNEERFMDFIYGLEFEL